VDADTGYGNPLNIHHTVAELIAAGAAGCFLEDRSGRSAAATCAASR
jgi:2-methylisocitrate lyase-like PEP mutase family enzyme